MRFSFYIFIFMPTLYRKYRPKSFSEVVGQNHVKITLENEIVTSKIAHAYLFCGPRAVGKTTFARLLAKSVNCLEREEKSFEPCGKCESCLEINEGRSLDIIEIDAASHTGVDNVRENIIASTRVSPAKSKFKVFIIDEVHMLSTSAFNALLKVLEEPPARIIFILCTTEIHKVPSTIISRCQRFDFRRISITDMVKKLKHIIDAEGIKADVKILEAIARQAEGHLRDAESLLGQIVAISGKEIKEEDATLIMPRSDIAEVINLLDILVRKDTGAGIALINKLLDSGVDLERFASDLIEMLRKLLLSKINPALGEKLGADFGESFEMKLEELLQKLEAGRLILLLEKFIETRQKLKSSFIVQLPFELAIAEICLETPKTQTLAGRISSPVAPVGEGKDMTTISAPIEKSSAPSVSVSSEISKEEFSARWNEFLVKIKKYNHSLSFILRVCELRGIDNGRICLAFKYKFHRDRINEISIRGLIEKTLAEVYGGSFAVEAILDENLEVAENVSAPVAEETLLPNEEGTPIGQNSDMMRDLLDAFGGKVVG